jgi:magnesium chelatase subunit H
VVRSLFSGLAKVPIEMKVTVFYIGSSLLAPLKNAERELNRDFKLDLTIAAHNFGSPLNDDEWALAESDLEHSDVVFVIHVMDGENASRLLTALEKHKNRHRAVVVINCMTELMRRTRMGRLNVAKFSRRLGTSGETSAAGAESTRTMRLFGTAGSWVGRQVSSRRNGKSRRNHTQYLKLVDRLPAILRFVPSTGAIRDVKHYLNLFCYFLQPTPANIRSMILYSLKEYVPDERLTNAKIETMTPEHQPSVAIYHPDASELFETFDEYRQWYSNGRSKSSVQSQRANLNPDNTIGLLLMRPQVVSGTTRHYDALIRSIEAEGLSVIPALSTLMDNRQAVTKFFIEEPTKSQGPSFRSHVLQPASSTATSVGLHTTDLGPRTLDLGPSGHGPLTTRHARVSQIISLTGFSFVGGPAMNDSEAAAEFLKTLNRPYRSAVSLDTQTIDAWLDSQTGLNPVQAGMQIAIPEIDGATEPFIYGGIPAAGVEPVALDDRCQRFARRIKRWNRLRTAPREDLKLALILFCFPPNKGNIGTAADLDVFPGVWDTLQRLQTEGYKVDLPDSAETLREMIIGGNAKEFGATANVAYRMPVDEYRRVCPYVDEVETEWGAPPGRVNSSGAELLIQGVQLGNIFVGVQPTFGYEGDPMRLMMARSGAPHHGFMAFYSYLSGILNVDAAVHVGTHGAMEFMPGKQVGMSADCWPDKLIGELPNIYVYSVNNPSEGSIAKRRSYAELISYLTPPIENAGLYKELVTLKDLVASYRNSSQESERQRLFEAIEECSGALNFSKRYPQIPQISS